MVNKTLPVYYCSQSPTLSLLKLCSYQVTAHKKVSMIFAVYKLIFFVCSFVHLSLLLDMNMPFSGVTIIWIKPKLMLFLS